MEFVRMGPRAPESIRASPTYWGAVKHLAAVLAMKRPWGVSKIGQCLTGIRWPIWIQAISTSSFWWMKNRLKKATQLIQKCEFAIQFFLTTQGIPTRLLQVPKPKAKLSQAVLSQSQIFSRAAPWMLKKSNRHCGHGSRYPLSHFYRRGKVTSSHFSFNEVLTVNKSSRTKSARELLARERFFKSPCIRTVHLC